MIPTFWIVTKHAADAKALAKEMGVHLHKWLYPENGHLLATAETYDVIVIVEPADPVAQQTHPILKTLLDNAIQDAQDRGVRVVRA